MDNEMLNVIFRP